MDSEPPPKKKNEPTNEQMVSRHDSISRACKEMTNQKISVIARNKSRKSSKINDDEVVAKVLMSPQKSVPSVYMITLMNLMKSSILISKLKQISPMMTRLSRVPYQGCRQIQATM